MTDNESAMKTLQSGDKSLGGGRMEHIASDDEFNGTLAKEMIKRTDKLTNTEIELAIRTKQAREFLAWSAEHLRRSWLDWMDESDKALKDIRMLRMAMESESKLALKAAADVRTFFLSDDHQTEISRLKELVDVVERLKVLKADGTLDAISDTILKLA